MKSKFQKEYERKQLVLKIVTDFKNKTKANKEVLDEYTNELLTLPMKDLILINKDPEETNKKRQSPISLLKGLKKKKAIMIHMYRKNFTIGHFVVSKYKRAFTIKDCDYLIDPKAMQKDTTYKMVSLSYHEGCVMPFIPTPGSIKGHAELKCDPQSFKQIFKFEYVELLTNVSKMKDLMKYILGASVIGALLTAAGLIIMAKGFNWI